MTEPEKNPYSSLAALWGYLLAEHREEQPRIVIELQRGVPTIGLYYPREGKSVCKLSTVAGTDTRLGRVFNDAAHAAREQINLKIREAEDTFQRKTDTLRKALGVFS